MSAQEPSQHAILDPLHVLEQLSSDWTHALEPVQRTGRLAGHGQSPALAWHELSWHMIGVSFGQSVLHVSRDAAQKPLSQRAGVHGGQGHLFMDAAHVPSQHVVSAAVHVLAHLFMSSTHDADPGHR